MLMILQANKMVGLCLVSCFVLASNAFGQQYQLYKDPGKRFEVSIPETWTFMPNYKKTMFLAYRPVNYKGESKIENVALSEIDDTDAHDLNAVYNTSRFSLKLRDSTAVFMEEGKPAKSNYYWYASSHTQAKTKETIRSLSVIYYVKNKAYVLQCTASPGSYEHYKTIFLKIAASLKFK